MGLRWLRGADCALGGAKKVEWGGIPGNHQGWAGGVHKLIPILFLGQCPDSGNSAKCPGKNKASCWFISGPQIPKHCLRKTVVAVGTDCLPLNVSQVAAQVTMDHLLLRKHPTKCKARLTAQALRVPLVMPSELGGTGSERVTSVEQADFIRSMWSQIWLCGKRLNTRKMAPTCKLHTR